MQRRARRHHHDPSRRALCQDATVEQVNDALAEFGGGIVSMSHGFPSVTIGIPPQSSVARLKSLVAQLESSPGILFAGIGDLPQPARFFPIHGLTDVENALDIDHLLPARFPAAWNLLRPDIVGDPAADTTVRPCPFAPVPVLMHDFFADTPPSSFKKDVPSANEPSPPDQGFAAADLQHGYETTEVLNQTGEGANPFPYGGCVTVQLVQAALNNTPFQDIDTLVGSMPSNERFIVSRSLGFGGNECKGLCNPPDGNLLGPWDRAMRALYWKERTFNRWPNFLLVNAAGNAHDKDNFGVYPGTGDSRFASEMAISQLTDISSQFVADDNLWTPSPELATQGFVSSKQRLPSSSPCPGPSPIAARLGEPLPTM